jgi:hypothetical protein
MALRRSSKTSYICWLPVSRSCRAQVEIVSSLDHVNELYIVMAGHVELVPPSSYNSSGTAITSGGGASTTIGSGGGVGSGGGAAAGNGGGTGVVPMNE